jgi:hypothetical protein
MIMTKKDEAKSKSLRSYAKQLRDENKASNQLLDQALDLNIPIKKEKDPNKKAELEKARQSLIQQAQPHITKRLDLKYKITMRIGIYCVIFWVIGSLDLDLINTLHTWSNEIIYQIRYFFDYLTN